ncbi:MAG: TonB-dependent receptor plug domain-containing protein [Opitutaceae bacterium]
MKIAGPVSPIVAIVEIFQDTTTRLPERTMNASTARPLIRIFIRGAVISGGLLGVLFGEPTDATIPAPTPVAAPPADVTVLEKYTVKGIPAQDQIMPTVRPISSVMGDARNIMDTPRSVSSISKELMEQVRLTSVTDFTQFSPGVYTAARYGLATTPMVRGDLAELYFNGQRTKYSRDSVQPSFNGVEALDIVKGPGSAVYGPQSNGASGYTNFVTKMPRFDGWHNEVSLSFGGLTADRDYQNWEWQLDAGGPLSAGTALRVSYLGRNGETYYQNTKDDTEDVYVSAIHRFSPTLTLHWWAEASAQTYTEVPGINRVTPALIDRGIYLGGVAIYDATTNTYTIAHPVLTPIKAWQSAVGTADVAHANRYQTQFILDKVLGATASLRNLTYLETRDSDKYEPSINYSENVPTDWNIQNRTEYHATIETGNVSHRLITGLDLKVERLIAYQSLFGEQYSLQDLTQDSRGWSNPGANIYVFGVPGDTKFGSDVGFGNYGGNQDSLIGDSAAFFQDDIKVTTHLSFIGGFRADHIKVDDRSPAFVDRGGYGSPGTLHPAGNIYDLSASANDTSYFLSSLYKVDDASSVYVTYNRTNATLGSPNFGGVTLGGTTPAALTASLRSLATLFEVGYKFIALNNRLYGAVAGYRQVRGDPDKFGHVASRIAKGLEGETVFQASKDFSLIANLAYQDVFRAGGTTLYQLNRDYYRLQPDGSYTAPGGGLTPVPYLRRYSGTPNWLGSARLFYRVGGVSIGFGPQITGQQKANAEGTIIIPTQYKINAMLAYSTKFWDFQVNLDNVTNQHNWTVGDPDFTGNTVIYEEKPFVIRFTTRHRF